MLVGCNMFEFSQTEVNGATQGTSTAPEIAREPMQPWMNQTPVIEQAAGTMPVAPGASPLTSKDLTPQQSTQLEKAIEDAGQLVSVINSCAAEQGDAPPSTRVGLEAQKAWYAEAVFHYRECVASRVTGVNFEGGQP